MIADKKVSLVYLVQTCPYNISALNTNGKSFQSYNVNLLWTRNYFGTSRFEATNLDYIARLDYKNTTSKYYDMRTATFELTLTRKYFKILVECAGPVGCLTILAGVSLFTRWQSLTKFLFLFFPSTVQFCDPARGHPRTTFTFVDTVPHDNQHSQFGFKKQPVRRLESKLTHHMDLYLQDFLDGGVDRICLDCGISCQRKFELEGYNDASRLKQKQEKDDTNQNR